MATAAEVAALKKIAEERYEEDGGTTAECCTDADLATMIDEDGGVEAAWKMAVRVYEAGYEASASYERDEMIAAEKKWAEEDKAAAAATRRAPD